jgi:hypothetical protein
LTTLYTCSYRAYRAEMGQAVICSLGLPKWPLAEAETWPRCWLIAPTPALFRGDGAEFANGYEARLDKFGSSAAPCGGRTRGLRSGGCCTLTLSVPGARGCIARLSRGSPTRPTSAARHGVLAARSRPIRADGPEGGRPRRPPDRAINLHNHHQEADRDHFFLPTTSPLAPAAGESRPLLHWRDPGSGWARPWNCPGRTRAPRSRTPPNGRGRSSRSRPRPRPADMVRGVSPGRATSDLVGPQLAAHADGGRRLAATALCR